jgi:hypothetical protein
MKHDGARRAHAGISDRGCSPYRLRSSRLRRYEELRGKPCAAHVIDGVIPSWARAGFSDPNPTINYEMGASGENVALL